MNAPAPSRIGTSGWHYDHWRGPFYPEDLPPEEFLAHYAARLGAAEINYSFYQLPERETLRAWRDLTPADFVFAAKASRYITHMKKLKDPAGPLANFYGRVEALEDKLGPILFQLPPNWHFDAVRLRCFLDALSEQHRHVFEFRDESWFCGEAYDALAAAGAAFCIYEIAGRQSPRKVTADFAYVRLHGPADEAYHGRYERQALGGWAGALSAWQREGLDVYGFFDNDEAGYAAQNALELQEMLS